MPFGKPGKFSIFSTFRTWPPDAMCSTMTVFSPWRAPTMPAVSPARPAPTTIRSYSSINRIIESEARAMYQPTIDVDSLIAIDIHVHAGTSAIAPSSGDQGPTRDDTLARITQRSGVGGQTP